MDDIQIIPIIEDTRTYALRVILDRNPSGWIAYCPGLLAQISIAYGETQKEAFTNLERALKSAGLVEGIQPLITL